MIALQYKSALKAYADRLGQSYQSVVLAEAQKDPALQACSLATLADLRNELAFEAAQAQLQAGRAATHTVGSAAAGAQNARTLGGQSPVFAPFSNIQWTPLSPPVGKYGSLSEAIERGTPVETQIGQERVRGALEGFDYKGRPVVRNGSGDLRIGAWAQTRLFKLQGASQPSSAPAIVGLKAQPMPQKLEAALQEAIDVDVCGKHSSREYIEAFSQAGYRVFVVGGALRDALRVLEKNPNATSKDIVATLKDVDIVTTAPTPIVRRVASDLAPELKDAGVHSPAIVDQFGTVLLGGPKAGLQNAEGLDIASLRSSGIGGEQQRNPDTGETVVPFVFDHNIEEDALARDFACNSLYAAYDPSTKSFSLVDPTGCGVEDAKNSFLRPNRAHLMKSDIVSLRFFKFRMRGFTSDADNTAMIKRHAEHFFPMGAGRLANMVLRIAPKDVRTGADLSLFLKQLRGAMQKDGCEGLFNKYIAPLEARMAQKLSNRFGSGT